MPVAGYPGRAIAKPEGSTRCRARERKRSSVIRLVGLVSALAAVAACGGGTSAADEVARSLANAKSADDASRIISKLRGEDGDERALVDAFCDGVTAVVGADGSPPDNTDWVDLLIQAGPSSEAQDVTNMLDRFDAGLSLAEQTNGGVALRYWQACLWS